MYPKYMFSTAVGTAKSRFANSASASNGPLPGSALFIAGALLPLAACSAMPWTMWAEMDEWRPLTARLKSRCQTSPSVLPSLLEKPVLGKQIFSWINFQILRPS